MIKQINLSNFINPFGYIYCHQNMINGKRYIGANVSHISKRYYFIHGKKRTLKTFLNAYCNNIYFCNALRKNGVKAFETTVLAFTIDLKDTNEKEAFYIQKYNTLNRKYGYNLQAGGYGNEKYSKKIKRKEKRYKNKVWLYNEYITLKKSSNQISREILVSFTTIINWLENFNIPRRSTSEAGKLVENSGQFKKGYKHSETDKKRISLISKKYWNNPETKKKMSEKMKLKWQDPNYRNNIISNQKPLKGKNHPQWKGDNAKREAMFQWIITRKFKPEYCEECGKEKKLELSSKTYKYTRNFDEYRWLCHSCNVKYDYKMGIRKYNPDNYIQKYWWDNITKENALEHLEWVKKNRHKRNYFRHKAKLKELSLIN